MPRLQAIVLLSTLISCNALGAGLDPVWVGRYSALVAGPAPEQLDPFALTVRTELPRSVLSVGRALEEVLAPSGYRLAGLDASCPSLPALLGLPLPAVHRRLGPMRLDEALKTLAGPAHYLVVDPVHRLVSFELRERYGAPGQEGKRVAPATAMAPIAMDASPEIQLLALSPLAPPVWGHPDSMPIPLSAPAHAPTRIGPIERGAELWPIAAKLREHFDAGTAQVMVGLFEANPASFCRGNLNCLKTGVYLDPPSAEAIKAIAPSDAHRIVRRHVEAWRERGPSGAALADARSASPATP